MLRKLIFILLLAALLSGVLLLPTAHAQSDSISLGEVQRALEAWVTGARVVTLYASGVGMVDYDMRDVSMRPFAPPWAPELHFCVDDYYLANIAWFTTIDDTYKEASTALDTIGNTLLIDGQPVDALRTPVTKLPRPVGVLPNGTEFFFGFNEGHIIEPGSLQPGQHTFGVDVAFSGVPIFSAERTFTVDAAGTGTCQ
ncbi:MAG: hypothetical protein R3272_16355 [Candidatus Promineifilaceae bacterium]|nr:hypothetical protein [Candidatus Promineifilaceae bacterium]